MFADLPLNLYELTVTLVPLVFTLVLYGRREKNQGFPLPLSGCFLLLVLGLYCIAVFHVTGSGTVWSGLRYGLDLEGIHLIPFSEGISLRGYFLNILMLMPLGFLLPLIYSHMDRLPRILLCGAGLSLAVELSQLLCGRATDIDDLLMNTLGACLGYGLYKLVGRMLKGRKPPRKLPASKVLMVPMAVFLARFLLYDELGFLMLYYGR